MIDDPSETPAEEDAEGEVLADAREFMELCKEANTANYNNGLDDLRFLANEDNAAQWDQRDAAQRTIDRRPIITVNKLPAFLHQVTNNLRQNRPCIKVHPVDGGADVETAKVRQGIIRHVEYASNADVAYDTAVCSAAAIGFGYYRLITDYCYPDSFQQDVIFKRIRNPFTVNFDPTSEEPDGSDQKRCLIESRMLRTEFERLYPKAEANNVSLSIGTSSMATHWMFTDEVVIAEFYRIEEEKATLCQLRDGSTAWKDEIPKEFHNDQVIAGERESFKRKVMLYKLTGSDILDQTEIKSYWIPVLPVYGDEIDLDGRVIRSGLIRHAKDPARMYNYWMTSATEEIAMRPKTPYIGADGQFDGFEEDWAQANNKSFPYLQYNQITNDGIQAPPPQRQPMADIPSGMLQMAMHANDNIKATTGLFDSSLGARGNATSGRQELAQQKQGDISNFHFSDSLMRTIRHTGRIINYMIPHYYDSERIVRIMGDDDTISSQTINQPIPPEQQQMSPQGQAIKTILNDMKGGQYEITVGSGPSYSTLRQEAAESMTSMASQNPNLMAIAGDLIVKSMDWPGADVMAARIKKTIDPKLTQGEDSGSQDNPEALKAQLAQAQAQMNQQGQQMQQEGQQLQQLGQQLQQAKQEIQQRDAELKAQSSELKSEKMALESSRRVFLAEQSQKQAEFNLMQSNSQVKPNSGAGEVGEADLIKADQEMYRIDKEQDTRIRIAVIEAKKALAVATINAEAKEMEPDAEPDMSAQQIRVAAEADIDSYAGIPTNGQ